ncbi:MAG: hypothetical protein J07AB43_09740 [Candidatus Nanosalina sp. J07AB43]|nr:MAG: hypothetical protein J07AB43_09740 [Candidatus Nanosalina sp. J07AB43]
MVDYELSDLDELYRNQAEILSDQIDTSVDPSRFKQMESNRLKGNWERILMTKPELINPISEIDSILADNDYPVEAHVGGEEYLDVSDGEKPAPGTLHLRISDSPDVLEANINNHFFQNMRERETLYHVENTPLAFEINDLFSESIPLETDTEYLQIRVPTKQAFFETSYQDAIESYGEFRLGDELDTSKTSYGNISEFAEDY